MKSKLYLTFLIVAVIMLLVIGCSGQGEKAEKPASNETEEITKTAETSVDEKTEEAGSTFASLKEDYLVEAEKLVTDWDEKLTSLEEKKNGLPEMVRKPLEEPFKAVMDKKTVLDGNFNDLKESGEESFNAKKDTFEGSLNELKSGYESLLGKF